MSRLDILETLYADKKRTALEFDYDKLSAPAIRFLFTETDVGDLTTLATSARYSSNMTRKRRMIDEIMEKRGFKVLGAGTNRSAYKFIEDKSFVAKVALDRAGLNNSPAEFKNQVLVKPLCTKIFEVTPSGVLAFTERVNPIVSLEEFYSVSEDIFNMMYYLMKKGIIFEDLGTLKYLNYGIRLNTAGCAFGPVLLDFPDIFEVDPNKIKCTEKISSSQGIVECGGDIDFDNGLNIIQCTKCGKRYFASELKKEEDPLSKYICTIVKKGGILMKAGLMGDDGIFIPITGRESSTYVTKEQYENSNGVVSHNTNGTQVVKKTTRLKRIRPGEIYRKQTQKCIKDSLQKQRESEEDRVGFNRVLNPVKYEKASNTKTKNARVNTQGSKHHENIKRVIVDTIYDSLKDQNPINFVNESDFDFCANPYYRKRDEYDDMYDALTEEQRKELEDV